MAADNVRNLSTKIEREIGWQPAETFASGIEKTVRWYLENEAWIASVRSGNYRQWIEKQYGSAQRNGAFA